MGKVAEGMVLVHVEVIQHGEQRYSTAGDWRFLEDGCLSIRVSDTGSRISSMLVALHEFAEAVMCEANGVTEKDVDDFDMRYEASRTEESLEEPGDDPAAPYHVQHKVADIVERAVALQSCVPWREHEERIEKLFGYVKV